jgi:hypothetical protein
MSLRPKATQSLEPPCAACGQPSESLVWGHRCCLVCWSDWHKAPEVDAVGVEQARYKNPYDFDSATAYRHATGVWLARRRAQVRGRAA